MRECHDLHHAAMDLADMANSHRRRGHTAVSQPLYSRAFELERQAADLVQDQFNLEPTRGVLHRSAAWLAVNAGRYDDARAIAERGLDGPHLHDEIREELLQVKYAARSAQRRQRKARLRP